MTEIVLLPVRCSGLDTQEEAEECHTGRLPVYGLLASPLMRLYDTVRLTMTSTAREQRLIVLHEAMLCC